MAIGGVMDVVCLGATCYDGWLAMEPHIRVWATHASWAGSRLVRFGDCGMRLSDLPPDLLDSAEDAGFAAARFGDAGNTPVSPYDYVLERVSHAWKLEARRKRLAFDLECDRGVVGSPLEAIIALLNPSYRLPLSGAIVLRNLSKKVFLHQDAIDDLNEEHQSVFPLTLGHAVTVHIGCSGIFEPSDVLDRGPWAGDRFDIVPEAMLEACADFEEWQDVSEEVYDSLRKTVFSVLVQLSKGVCVSFTIYPRETESVPIEGPAPA
jgi:hypothetical protein